MDTELKAVTNESEDRLDDIDNTEVKNASQIKEEDKLLTDPVGIKKDSNTEAEEQDEIPGKTVKKRRRQEKQNKGSTRHKKQPLAPFFFCCSYLFSKRRDLFLHLQSQQLLLKSDTCNPFYVCSSCLKTFKSYVELHLHSRTHYKALAFIQYKYCCDGCSQLFGRFDDVKKHQSKCNGVRDSSKKLHGFSDLKTEFATYQCAESDETANEDCHIIIVQKELNNFAETFTCDMCYDVLNDSMAFLKHMIFHKEIDSKESKKEDCHIIIVQKESNNFAKKFTCDMCYDVLNDSMAFLKHMNFHKEINNKELEKFSHRINRVIQPVIPPKPRPEPVYIGLQAADSLVSRIRTNMRRIIDHVTNENKEEISSQNNLHNIVEVSIKEDHLTNKGFGKMVCTNQED